MSGSIIWDWNGTLLDDVEICIAAMNRLLARRGLGTLTLRRYREVFTFPVQVYYERMGFDFDRESFADVAVEYHDAYEELVLGADLHADALASLQAFRLAGLRQALLSALEQSRLEKELRTRGISGYFTHVFGLEDLHARSKAHRGRELVRALGVDGARDCWMIGDTAHDADVAAQMGVRCVLVGCGHHGREQLEETGVPVFPCLREAVYHVRAAVEQEG